MDGRMDVIRAGNDKQPPLYNRNRVRTKTAVYPKPRKERIRKGTWILLLKKNAVPADWSADRVACHRGYGDGAGYSLPNHERMTG